MSAALQDLAGFAGGCLIWWVGFCVRPFRQVWDTWCVPDAALTCPRRLEVEG